ncbi:hypothetical protein [Paenibacillus humicola]|uniref:hypothetical protein n=1 Tax=Paenibacillus humicola TaxID=3110540 RepID=UPI00237B8C52|nr:hypothetical protein [Paenibacillus humicola]
MSLSELSNHTEQVISIPVYSHGRIVDRLVAIPGSRPVQIPEGMQFTDSFGIHPARTEGEYRTPLSVEAIVMTDSTNIVLEYAKGEVILNWDRREDLLHVRHPATGQAFELTGKGDVPAGRWHRLEWMIAEDRMRLLVNGEERFSLDGNYRGLQGKIGVRTGWRANLSVGSLHIAEHRGTDEAPGTGYRAISHPDALIGCLLGAMRYCNRYADEIGFLGGIGYWFQSLSPREAEHGEAGGEIWGRIKAFGLECRRLVPAEGGGRDIFGLIGEALDAQDAVFGRFGGEDGYAAVIGMDEDRLQLSFADGTVRATVPGEADRVFAVSPGAEESLRTRTMQSFQFAAESGRMHGPTFHSEWLSEPRESEAAAFYRRAGELAERRKRAARYVRDCRDAAGFALSAKLEAAVSSYDEAGALWEQAAERFDRHDSEAGSFAAKAIAAETEGSRVLGEIAEALAGAKRLEGLRYWGTSCISQHNTLKGVADYYRIPGSEAWLLGASGRPFAFAVHERINVHDICLPIPDDRFVQLFANVGLDIGSVEGSGTENEYRNLLQTAWNEARKAINEGWACFGRSIDFDRGEYALIIGYDQDGYYTHGWHGPSRKAIPWNMYGLGQCMCYLCTTRREDRLESPVKSVCLCDACQRTAANGPAMEPQREGEVRLYWAKPAAPADDRTIIRDTLQFAVAFADPEGPWAQPGLYTGIQAYDHFIRALEKGTVDGWYLGLYANGWQECRKLALEFLREGKRKIGNARLNETFDTAIREAERLQSVYAKLYEMFPWMQPFGPIPDTERRYAGADLLRLARKHEIAAIESYRALLNRLE